MARPRFGLTTLLALTGAVAAALGLFVALTGASTRDGWGRDPELAALFIGAMTLSGVGIGGVSERGGDRTLVQIGLSLVLTIALVRLVKTGSFQLIDLAIAALMFLGLGLASGPRSAPTLRGGSRPDWPGEASVMIFSAVGGLLLASAMMFALWFLACLRAVATGEFGWR